MRKKHGMLIALEKIIEQFAGEEVMKRVMEGSESIFEKTDAKKKASWMKGAMERLDKLVDEGTKLKIMENCGHNACMSCSLDQTAVCIPESFNSHSSYLGRR